MRYSWILLSSLALLAAAMPGQAEEAAAAKPAEKTAATPVVPSGTPQPPDQSPPDKDQVTAMIPAIARQYGVEEALVRAVVAAESNYHAYAVSRAGAIGLMQLMPATAADYGVTDASRLFDSQTNLRVGTRHLHRLLSKYKNDYGRVIMAYNAGEGVVDRTHSQVTYLETLNYTEAVITYYRRFGGKQPTQEALNRVRVLRGMRYNGNARRLLKKYLDPSLLSLRVKPTLDIHYLSPSLHETGPATQPMFELQPVPER